MDEHEESITIAMRAAEHLKNVGIDPGDDPVGRLIEWAEEVRALKNPTLN